MPGRTDRARSRLLDLINASWTTQVIAAGVQLGVVDLLAEGPRALESLARASACHPSSLARLLRALASLDLVVQYGAGAYALTRTGSLLRTDASDSLAWWSLLCGGRSWAAWAELAESVRTGQSQRRRAGGPDDFSSLKSDRAASDAFHRAMCNLTRPIAEAMVRVVDFAGVDTIVDVGGGYGQLVSTILGAHPRMRGVLFDLEHALAGARQTFVRAQVAERCELVAGSFFEAIPGGAGAYMLKSVLHNWDDEHCAVILRQCARAMGVDRARVARLFVIERLRPERLRVGPRARAIARSDLNMLVALGGRERTRREYADLLEESGLRIVRIAELASEFSVIEARSDAQFVAPG